MNWGVTWFPCKLISYQQSGLIQERSTGLSVLSAAVMVVLKAERLREHLWINNFHLD